MERKAQSIGNFITKLGLIFLFGIGVIVIWIYQDLLWTQIKMYDKTRIHRPYTYKIGKDGKEYLTIEKVGKSSYAYYFHATPYNPKTDYFIVSESIEPTYPTVELSYLDNSSNEIFIWTYDSHHFYLDTVVSSHYKFTPEPVLHKNDSLYGMKINDQYFEETARRREWRDSMFNLPEKLWVRKHDFNKIVYQDSNDNSFIEATVVKRGK